MSRNAALGFFNAWGDEGARGFAKDLASAINEGRQGAAIGEARRSALAEANGIDDALIDVPTGEFQQTDPNTGDVLDSATALRFQQEEGVSPKRKEVIAQKRRGDVEGDTNVEALYLTKYLPAKVQELRNNGSNLMADQLDGYVRTETGKQHSSLYANMVKAHSAGNFQAAAKYMEQLQELSGEDTNATVLPDGAGGYKMKLAHRKNGTSEEYELGEDKLYGDMGMFAYMDPVKMVDRFDKQAKAAAESMATIAKEKEQTRRQIVLKGLDYKYDAARDRTKYLQDIQKLVTQHNLDLSKPTDVQRVHDWLERSGAPTALLEEYKRGIVAGKGSNPTRQAPNPQDLIREFIQQKSAIDDAFASLPVAEQVKQATAYVKQVQQATTPPPPAARPSSNGLPPLLR